MMEFPKGQTLSHRDLVRDEEVACDVAVIGSGASGAAVAWELAKAGLSVAILEEGRKFEPKELVPKPSVAYRNLYSERNTRLMMGPAYIPLTGGRAVGGATLINSSICFPPPAKVLKRWHDEFGISWADAQTLAPFVAEVEEIIGVDETTPGQARKNNLIFKRGTEALGLRGGFIRRNAPGCIGLGVCQLGCPLSAKGSVDQNFIPESLEKGAALFTSAQATRLLVERGRCVGVEAHILDPLPEEPISRLTVRAKKVFLCAGAVSSPILLLRQGACNSSGLVGRNLHVHPALGMCARFEELVDAWDGVTQGYYVELEDSMLETFSTTPDLYFAQFGGLSEPLEQIRHIASCGCMIGDESSGQVKPGPGSRANISYRLEQKDMAKLVRGLRVMGKVFYAAGALEVQAPFHGAPLSRSQSELEQVCHEGVEPSRAWLYASHPMGTCRMGADRNSSVVSPTGETFDVKDLFIADASVFPTSLGVNPQITIMAVALLLARQAIAPG